MGLWKRDGRSGSRGNKVLKSQPGWRSVNQVRRLRILMTVVAVVILISVTAGLLLVWHQLHPSLEKELFASSAPEYSEPAQSSVASSAPELLILVNSDRSLAQSVVPDLTKEDGVEVDKRLAAAYEEMKRSAAEDGVTLNITRGYVTAEQQEELYKQKVQELVASGYTQVRAEDTAQSMVERGGHSEYQTGLAVDFELTGGAGGAESKWLLVNSPQYGFVLRYPENKTSVTQRGAEPQHFRYVGQENAQRMRQMGFCLEEYVSYLAKQSKK
ncbi:M15 family metallopeptidase [Faecalispora anaeroviscerum]|uniref:M15 family metallopeptidase n=1 Tax=Faecalispora anaeroviscerum TaxID=2991836 RepID=UPI0024BAB90C|nr:M15 family metallopeptidase [Faecalispora anaeroviscerum]